MCTKGFHKYKVTEFISQDGCKIKHYLCYLCRDTKIEKQPPLPYDLVNNAG